MPRSKNWVHTDLHGEIVGIIAAGVIRVHTPRQRELTDVVLTVSTLGLLLRPPQRWQKHAGQNRDHGDHHQQLDQGKCRRPAAHRRIFVVPMKYRWFHALYGQRSRKRAGAPNLYDTSPEMSKLVLQN